MSKYEDEDMELIESKVDFNSRIDLVKLRFKRRFKEGKIRCHE